MFANIKNYRYLLLAVLVLGLSLTALAAPGDLDVTFDTDGKVTTPIGASNDDAFDIAIQTDGRIVLAGVSSNGSNTDFAVARYLGASTGYLYVVNDSSAGNQIYGFSVNETTGALTALVGFPVATGAMGCDCAPTELTTLDRVNNRLYVINDGSETVSAYSINPTTGALTALPFSPISLGAGDWKTIAVHPTGSPLVISDGDMTPVIRSFTITAGAGVEAAGSPFSTGTNARPYSSVFSQNGSFFYTGGRLLGGHFAGFSVAPATGVLTALAGSPFNFGADNPLGYATDSQGRLFSANFSTGGLRVFTTMSGVPSAATGNPFASGLSQPIDGVLHPNEQFYFASDNGGNQIGSFQIGGTGAATTLTAVAGSPFASGSSYTNSLITNQAGTFLFTANGFSRNLTTYSVNPTNGVLTNIGIQPANTLGTSGVLAGIAYYTPPLAPSAATVMVGGQVTTASGRSISRARVALTDGNGETRYAFTSSFGYFRFEEIQVGETYIFEVRHKSYQFVPQVLTINDEVIDLNFVGEQSFQP